MRLIINTSNMAIGGGVQVALSFLEELKEIANNNEYFVFLSAPVAMQLELANFPSNFRFYHFPVSPARLRTHWRVLRQFSKLESEIKPDVVFTVFGPSYWRPRNPHVMGFAVGWVINPDSIAFKKVGIRKRLENRYKTFHLKREADFYIVETEEVGRRLNKYLYIANSRIAVVSNTFNKVFEGDFQHYGMPVNKQYFNLISISANYPHKNLKIIKDVVPFLQTASFKCKFWLTIPPLQFQQDFGGLSDWVSNLGPVDVRWCPSLYQQADALFLPTLLESFTASYPEAMKMKKPILTSNLGFARSICGDAAEYFDPLDPGNIAECITRVGTSPERQQELVRLGDEQLRLFPTPRDRARRYLEICSTVAEKA